MVWFCFLNSISGNWAKISQRTKFVLLNEPALLLGSYELDALRKVGIRKTQMKWLAPCVENSLQCNFEQFKLCALHVQYASLS